MFTGKKLSTTLTITPEMFMAFYPDMVSLMGLIMREASESAEATVKIAGPDYEYRIKGIIFEYDNPFHAGVEVTCKFETNVPE